jgi:hypothetical protein
VILAGLICAEAVLIRISNDRIYFMKVFCFNESLKITNPNSKLHQLLKYNSNTTARQLTIVFNRREITISNQHYMIAPVIEY